MKDKFVLKDDHVKNLQSDIEKTLKNGYNDLCGSNIISSDITKCDRRLYYAMVNSDIHFSKKKEVHKSALIHKWCGILDYGDLLEVMETEFLAADCNHNVYSVIDIIGNISEIPVVINIEEISDEDFSSGNAKRKHVIDTMIQMWLAEVNDGFLIYENLFTKEYNIFHILPNVSVLNAVKKKLINLSNSKISGTLPERKYETSNSKECKECSYCDRCWR